MLHIFTSIEDWCYPQAFLRNINDEAISRNRHEITSKLRPS